MMNNFDLCEVFAQGNDEAVGKHGDAVVAALAIVDQDAMIVEINVLHAQSQTFHEPKPAAVHQLNHEFIRACQVGDDGARLFPGKHNRNTLPLFGPDEGERGFVEFDLQEIAIKEENGAERLILRRSGCIPFDDKVGDELVDLSNAHLARVTFVVKKNVLANPMGIGFFGARGVLFQANLVTVLVEQFFPLR